jgi:hypothetical protein
MSVITAYKCDSSGKLFDDKKKYICHLKKLAKNRLAERKINRFHIEDTQWWHDNFWNHVKSINQLKAAILHHRDVFAARGVKKYFSNKKLKATPITKINNLYLKWSDTIPNTHRCPHNGVANWNRRFDLPSHYSGWIGRIDYEVQSFKDQVGTYPGSSDMWTGTRIHTGSGGGGHHNNKNYTQKFSYDITLFADDWPAMTYEREKVKTLFLLKHSNDKSLIFDINIEEEINRLNPPENIFEYNE